MSRQSFSPSMKVAVFVDVQNLYYGALSEYDARLNYGKFIDWVVRDRTLTRAIAYIVEAEDSNQNAFKNVLRTHGFEIMSKPLIRRADGSSKGNWDLAIAMDAVSIAPKVDAVVLATGDGDFMYVAEYLRNHGCRVEAAGFESSTSENLVNSVNEFRYISDEVCEKPKRSSRS